MPDPSLLVSVPTLAEPSMAPPDRHVLYVLEPVPNLDGQVDWVAERPRLRADLEAALDRLGYPTDIDAELLVDPLDWQRRASSGARPSPSRTPSARPGPFRPGNVERRAPGLVFVGSGTVPGVGVPMVLVSGELAAARVNALRGTG